MMPKMSPRVEEFYNRVHSPRDGKFSTSGTGGGHYKGRSSGAKAPGRGGKPGVTPARVVRGQSSTVRTGTGKATHKTATPGSGHAAGKVKGKMGMENNSSRFYTNSRKASVKAKAKAAPPKHDAKAHVAGVTARLQAQRAAAKAAHKAEPSKAAPKQSDHDRSALDAINRVRTHKETGTKSAYADAHKTEVRTIKAGPGMGNGRGTMGKAKYVRSDGTPVSKDYPGAKLFVPKSKAPLSSRVSNFLKKAGNALDAINPTGGVHNTSTDSKTLAVQRMAKQDADRRKRDRAYAASRG